MSRDALIPKVKIRVTPVLDLYKEGVSALRNCL